MDTNMQPIRFIPVILSDKCPYCNDNLILTNVKVAIYNKNTIETGYANRNLLTCNICKLHFVNQEIRNSMTNKILPNHFEFFLLTELTSINDKDLLLEKMFCKSDVPVQKPLKTIHPKRKAINNVKISTTHNDNKDKKYSDFARHKNFNIIINKTGISIRHLPIIDGERCPCCDRKMGSLLSPIAIYDKFNQYIGNAEYPLSRCSFCEISYANNEKLKLIGKQLGQYHAELFKIQDIIDKDSGSMIAKDLVKGKMYSTKSIPIPECLKEEYGRREREKRERLKQEQDKYYSDSEIAIAHQADSDSDNDNNNAIDFDGKINLINNEYIVWVYRSTVGCYNHIIKPVKAVVKDLDDKIVTIFVDYCSQCNKYYIDEVSLSIYHKRFGIILLRIDLHESLWQGTNDFNRKSESILMYFGYTVRQGVLTESQRHKLLAKIIDNGLIERGEVIKYLRMFIDTNGASFNNRYAKIRWQNDLDFIREHNASRVIHGKLVHI